MRTLVLADLHLSANPRDAYRHDIISMLATTAQRMGVSRTAILGDLTEEKDRHGDWLVNKVVDHVRSFARLGPVDVLQGNHDSQTDPDMPFFRFLRHVPNVRWIGKPTAECIDGLGRVLWLPHTRNVSKAWDGLSFVRHAYIFAHCTFVGASLGNNRQAEGGSGGGVSLKRFPSDCRIISGDVHIPQSFGCVTYVGAPYTVDFGDRYQGRVLLINGDKVRSIDVEGPQKRLLEFAGDEKELDQLDDLNEGDILKLKVHVPRSAAPRWAEQRDRLREHYEKKGFVVHTIVPVISEKLGKTKMRVVRDTSQKTDEQVMRSFARHSGVDKKTLRIGEKLI